jgi:uncharacterized protein YbaR (Trm112 family)
MNKIYNLLVCPHTGTELILFQNHLYSNFKDEFYRYPLINGVPVLLIESAEKIDISEWEEATKNYKSTDEEIS